MPLVALVSREPRMRAAVEDYLANRGYQSHAFESYDAAMLDLLDVRPQALVVDVQGVPRGETGTNFAQFSQWVEQSYNGTGPGPGLVYLLRKGARRPHFRIPGTVLKKPFAFEELGEALRVLLGNPLRDATDRELDLDVDSGLLRSGEREVHLTNIEANLLDYLIEHEGEILQPNLLLVEVWRYHSSAGASTLVRAHVSNLRRKLREVTDTDEQIETIRGKGYRYIA